MPPILVGSAAEAALARTVAHADGWFGLPLPPVPLRGVIDRLDELAAAAGRRRPALVGSAMVAFADDPEVPGPDGLADILTDPDGLFGMPREAVPGMVGTDGGQLAGALARWEEPGAERVVLTVAAGDWFRQAEIVAGMVPS